MSHKLSSLVIRAKTDLVDDNPKANRRASPLLQKAVWIVLADMADDITCECFPSDETIAMLLGASRQSVGWAIDALNRQGWIIKVNRKGRGWVYKVLAPAKSGNSTIDSGNSTIEETPKSGNSTIDSGNSTIEETAKCGNSTTKDIYSSNNNNITKSTYSALYKGGVGENAMAARAQVKLAYNLRWVATEALSILKAEGMNEFEAKNRLRAVKAQYLKEARELDAHGKKIVSPKAYFPAKMAGMAKSYLGEAISDKLLDNGDDLKTQIANLKIKLLARKQCLAEDIAAEKPASVIEQTKQAIERLVSKISELEQAREVA